MSDSRRIHLPEELVGPWVHAVIATYNVNLPFYEHDLARKLGSARNRIILVDDAMLAEAFAEAAETRELRHVNAGYLASPVRAPGSAHAKFILLTAPDKGRLLVGSGNLTMSGYARQGEQFTRYDRDDEIGDLHLGAFVAIKELLEGLVQRGWVDDLTAEHLDAVWADTGWLFRTPPEGPRPVRHNLDVPLLDQFVDALGEQLVDRLVVHAPYWDGNCSALAQLITRTRPTQVTVLVQPGDTQVAGDRLESVLEAHAPAWKVLTVQPEQPARLHAKFVIAEHGDRATCLQGSANLSVAALVLPASRGNVEATNLLTGPTAAFAPLVDLLTVGEPINPSALPSPTKDEDDDAEPPGVRILQSEWDGRRLSITLSSPPSPESLQVLVGDDPVEDATAEGPEVAAVPNVEHAERLDRASPIAVRASFSGGPATTPPVYPRRTKALRALLAPGLDDDTIRRIANLDLTVDDDIEDLLRQLDDVLIIDQKALWQVAGQRRDDDAEDDHDTSTLRYADLDLERLARHPKFARYRRTLAPPDPNVPSEANELQILLGALTGRLGDLGRPVQAAATVDDPRPSISPEEDPESEELDEQELAARREQQQKHRQEADAQRRRTFTRFVGRFTRGVTDPGFAELVGPQFFSLNVIIFTALVGRLIAKDQVDSDTGVDALLETWEFLWGQCHDGYLHELHSDDRGRVDALFAEHRALPIVLASIYRADETCRQHGLDMRRMRLRDHWRRLLTDPDTTLSQAMVTEAADEATSAWADPATRLYDALAQLAHLRTLNEIGDAIVDPFAVDHHAVTEKGVKVVRDSHKRQERELRIGANAERFDAERVATAMATWMRLDPDRDYYRLYHEATRGRAVIDLVSGERWWMADRFDEMHPIKGLPDTGEPWEEALEGLRP